jgi:DNA segregation ATPase FtsK/SpoIIIE, S-DNA-T family
MKILIPTSRPRLNEVVAVVFLLAALAFGLCLASYTPLDLSWNTAGQSVKPVNLLGPLGAYASDVLLQIFGLAAWAFPISIICLGWKWVRSETIAAPAIKVFGFVLLSLATCSAFGLLPDWRPIARVIPASGVLGMLLATFLVSALNETGAWLVTVGALVISVYLVSAFRLSLLSVWFALPLAWSRRLWDRFRDWRDYRAAKAAANRAASMRQAQEAAREAHLLAAPPPAVNQASAKRTKVAAASSVAAQSVVEMKVSGKPAVQPYSGENLPFTPAFSNPKPATALASDPLQTATVLIDEIPIHTIEEQEREELPPRPVEPPRLVPKPTANGGAPRPKASHRRSYVLPPTDLLTEPPPRAGYDSQELKDTAARIKAKFEEFNVLGSVTQINPGPVVTTFEFKPEAGIKYSRITSLHEDLCLGLQAESILIERIPGKPTVGIEVPNSKREVIALREVLESAEFQDSPSRLTLSLGKDISGRIKVASLETMPHCLIAGSTGSGKSVMLNTLIMSVLYKSTPDEVRMILVDPKRLEMGLYEGVPHLLTPVITDPKKATNALRNAVFEMERRLKLLAIQGVRNIDQYNRKVKQMMNEPRNLFEEDDPEQEAELRPLPFILIIIDELADLMMLERAGVEESVTRLAQMARAVGMHLVLATQRPSVDVITGLIKANFPSRISFRVATRVDSRTVLDVMGAEHLLGKGDMLYLPPGSSRLSRIHGAFVSETETNKLVEYWKRQAEPEYDKSFLLAPPTDDDRINDSGEEGEDFNGSEDPVYQDAVRVICEMGKASTSILQRRLRLGYGRAARILDMAQRDGIIGPPDGSRPREVLKRPDWLDEVASLP